MNTIIYSIVQNKTNKVIFTTDNYDLYKQFVITHFPATSYTYKAESDIIFLTSKNFTPSITLLNEDMIQE